MLCDGARSARPFTSVADKSHRVVDCRLKDSFCTQSSLCSSFFMDCERAEPSAILTNDDVPATYGHDTDATNANMM
jgi:hypothetical protein